MKAVLFILHNARQCFVDLFNLFHKHDMMH